MRISVANSVAVVAHPRDKRQVTFLITAVIITFTGSVVTSRGLCAASSFTSHIIQTKFGKHNPQKGFANGEVTTL